MIKRISVFIGVVLLLVLVCVAVFGMVTPKIVLINNSPETIVEAEFQLPSNRISFDNVVPSSSATIYYSLTQGDGAYHYSIHLQSGLILNGQCGYIANNEFGKRMEIVVTSKMSVVCTE